MRLLEVCTEIRILGYIGKELERHENIILARHRWKHELLRRCVTDESRQICWRLNCHRVGACPVDDLGEPSRIVCGVDRIHDAAVNW